MIKVGNEYLLVEVRISLVFKIILGRFNSVLYDSRTLRRDVVRVRNKVRNFTCSGSGRWWLGCFFSFWQGKESIALLKKRMSFTSICFKLSNWQGEVEKGRRLRGSIRRYKRSLKSTTVQRLSKNKKVREV